MIGGVGYDDAMNGRWLRRLTVDWPDRFTRRRWRTVDARIGPQIIRDWHWVTKQVGKAYAERGLSPVPSSVSGEQPSLSDGWLLTGDTTITPTPGATT